ncbi:MAG: 50S ribosomal protein L6 [Chitinispirillaceae bacterium]|nr:50S ribosomal protein L6 [Chitinispirillaceae bacterium]
MSRIGKVPIQIPRGVQVTVQGQLVEVKGDKGVLCRHVNKGISIVVEDDTVRLQPQVSGNPSIKALWGLNRVLIRNMIVGVTTGYRKELEIVGIGYKAEMKGKDLNLTIGFSRPLVFKAPEGIRFNVENQVKIAVEGIDKEKVGKTAAEIRCLRPPEPYKGKGIRYVGEYVRRKAGKTAGK